MSTDDLGYLCQWNGGGQPLMTWEVLPFRGTAAEIKACIADHVEYWIDIQTESIWINSVRGKKGLPPIGSEYEMYLLHKYVCEKRWRRAVGARPV